MGPNGAGKTSTLSAIEGLLTPAARGVGAVGRGAATEPLAVRALIGVQLQASSFRAELVERHRDDPRVLRAAHGEVTPKTVAGWTPVGGLSNLYDAATGSVGWGSDQVIGLVAGALYAVVFGFIGVRWFRWTVR